MSGGSGISVDTRTPEQIRIDRKKVTDWKRSTLLSSADGAWPSEISIEEFVNYTRYVHSTTAYFSDTMVNWSLELLRRKLKKTQSQMTIILSSQFGGILHGIAMGTQTNGRFVGRPDISNPYLRPDGETDEIMFEGSAVIPEDFLAVQQQFKAEHDALQGKRYVFIPINDGYKSLVEGRIWIEDEDALSVGNHWSFIVVDTFMKTARYIDSLVTVGQGASGKDKIENTQINGEVAGMGLYGFNTFIEYPKGAFRTSTLK
jgi:hypothetical protein